jgi:signal transduction histidine kinase
LSETAISGFHSTTLLANGAVQALFDSLDRGVLVAERSGTVSMANLRARQVLSLDDGHQAKALNLFEDLLRVEPRIIFDQIEGGEHEVDFRVLLKEGQARARIQWLPEPDWLLVQLDATVQPELGPAEQHTVQELLQEREITYRNLLAAYLRLQEVNRQKTVFLASAAHELKTPLAVIKGYYDLLLSGSLGKLSSKQRDILQESKESCDRLVRLISMFLNYSALESGKLVLLLHDNDLRDCLAELAHRWHDPFTRKKVRLELTIDPSLPIFRFDYQKVQQAVANLLDNALKHTPSEGTVTLSAAPYFWERRSAGEPATQERRRLDLRLPNSARISVADTGRGIAPEYHQEIFEDFVRLDRTSSGMGLGLAIAKRLVHAHRGKIWVDSETGRGANFTILLPCENC